jgi:hypothetical protein
MMEYSNTVLRERQRDLILPKFEKKDKGLDKLEVAVLLCSRCGFARNGLCREWDNARLYAIEKGDCQSFYVVEEGLL